MPGLVAGITGFIDKYLLGYALGTAAGPALEPYVQRFANEGWQHNRILPLEAELAAQLVASGRWQTARGDTEASQTGIDPATFPDLVHHALTSPGVPELLTLWRRGLIGEGAVDEGLAKLRILPELRGAIKATYEVVLSPDEAANAWQQGYLDEGPAEQEAALSGVPSWRSRIQRLLVGLPPGAMDGLTLLRRNIIDEATYRQLVREGHTKTKYTDALLALRWNIISARDAAELWLRGWISEAQAKALGELNGYDAQAMDWLYLNRGRPATTHQVWVGLRHGARRGPPAGDIEPDFLAAVRNSNIRDEYANLLWASRFNYPSLFVMNRLILAGAMTPERGVQILTFQGYEQTDIDALHTYWTQPGGAVTAKWADRARSRLFTVAHNAFVAETLDADGARAALGVAGVGAAESETVLGLWGEELAITRLSLTPAQIKKAWSDGLYDDAQAVAALVALHMTEADARTFLES